MVGFVDFLSPFRCKERSDGGYIGIYTLPKSGQVNFYGVTTTTEWLLILFHNEH